MENTRQPIPLRIRQHLRDAVGRMHPSVSFVSCIGVLLAYLTGVYITGSLHEASRWMGAMLACTSLVVVLQSHNYKDSLRAGWTRVLGTFLGALVAYIYLKIWPFSIVGMLASVFVLEMLCMLVGIYQNNRIATITLLIILLVSQMTPHVSPAVNCLLRFTESVVGVGVGVALLWVLERWKRWLEPQEHANIATDKNMNMDTMPLRWGHFRVLIVASLGQITGAGLATLVGVILPMIQIFRHPGLTSCSRDSWRRPASSASWSARCCSERGAIKRDTCFSSGSAPHSSSRPRCSPFSRPTSSGWSRGCFLWDWASAAVTASIRTTSPRSCPGGGNC